MLRTAAFIAISLFCASGCVSVPAKADNPSALSCAVDRGFVIVRFNSSSAQEVKRPKYFGIDDGERFMYLNYFPAKASLTNYDAGTKELKLSARDQMGILYAGGKPSLVPVFAKGGVYNLLFADDLETEPENTFSLQCSIQIRK